MCFALQPCAIFRHQNFQKFSTFSLPNALFATAACNFCASELPKVLRTPHVLYVFTSKCAFSHSGAQFFDIRTSKSAPTMRFLCVFTSTCAFRHSGVQFFDIRTSKSAPKLTCFVHVHFKMRFSPQRRAIFDFSSEHLPPHPPLSQAYFSTDPTHESSKKRSISRLL